MITLQDVWNQTEGKSRIETEIKCQEIIKEIEKIYNIHFNLETDNQTKISYLNAINMILLYPGYTKYRKALINLLNNYHINMSSLIFYLTGIINQINLPKFAKDTFVKSISEIISQNNFSSTSTQIQFDTGFGKIHIFQFDKISNSKNLMYKIQKEINSHNSLLCHEIVKDVAPLFSSDYITTSEMPALFGNIFYHSYITLKDNQGVIDISSNTFYPNNDFTNLYHPNELLKIKANELSDVYQSFINEETDKTEFSPLLQLALNNKRKML
jgi:hypothetical protein